jgi:hypothetical protein
MLAVTGGRERTLSELSALLQPTGFTAGRIIETAGPMSIVEAKAV